MDTSPLAWRRMLLVVGAVGLLLMLLNGRYGYHRDELYFLACGRHPAWGYPDQPPLTPMLAWFFDKVGGGSLVVFRIPAVASALIAAWVTGLLARELGGRSRAQLLATLATSIGTFPLLAGHLLVTATPDLAVWVTLTWLVLRITRTGDVRLWPAAGAVVAVGLLNKELVLVLVVGLVVGVLCTPHGTRLVLNRWFAAAVAVAVVVWVPVLVWQAQHGWPQLTIAGQIRAEYGTPGERLGFVALQLLLFSLGATVLWVVGAVRLWRDEAWRYARVLVVAWLFTVIVFMATAGQGYYTIGLYPGLIAAGAVVLARHRIAYGITALAVVLSSALFLPVALPVLPATTLAASGWSDLGETQRETVGWPREVAMVDAAYRSIPPAARVHAGILTDNYGEAGAVDRLGPAYGLPQAYSGLNGFGLWGPPPSPSAPVVVVWEGGSPARYLTGCRLFRKVLGPVPNEEHDYAAIYVCAGPRGGWARLWPRLVHLSN